MGNTHTTRNLYNISRSSKIDKRGIGFAIASVIVGTFVCVISFVVLLSVILLISMYPEINPAPWESLSQFFCQLGVFSLVASLYSIAAIILGAVAKKRGNSGKMPTAGLLLGIISLAVLIITAVIYFAMAFSL